MYRGSSGSFGYYLSPWVKRLIIANAVILLVMWLGGEPAARWAFEHLGFSPSWVLTQPWTIITYMFVHANFFHLFFNMLALFFFGPPLEQRWGGTDFIKYYAICGVGGALFSFIFSRSGIPIVGASGAVFGVMLAYALNWPDNQIWIWGIFPVKAKYFVLFLGGLSFFSAFSASSDGIAHFAHLGGLVVGYVYLKKGWEVGARFEGLKKRLRKRKLSVVAGGLGKDKMNGSPKAPPDEEAQVLEAVDRLLDKIKASGLDSLTAEERKFLDEVSRRRQMRH
jgi:membrane associated rhomboid family serine protease